jgi:hypothetical protein
VFRLGGPTIDRAFLIPLLVMAVAFSLLFVTLHLAAMRNEILRRRVRARSKRLRELEAEAAWSGAPAAARRTSHERTPADTYKHRSRREPRAG